MGSFFYDGRKSFQMFRSRLLPLKSMRPFPHLFVLSREGWLITRNLKTVSGLAGFGSLPRASKLWINSVHYECYLSRKASWINCCGIPILPYWHVNHVNATKRCSLPLSLWAVPLRVALGGTCASLSLHHQVYNCTNPPLTHFPAPHNAGAMVQQ